MVATKVPLVVLGGRDRSSTTLPGAGQDKHLLTGYKGVDLRIGGRPLISLVLERLQATGAFDPIFVAGPLAIYRPVWPEERILPTDGFFGENLRHSLEGARARCPGQPIGFTTCDILPKVEELSALMADFHRRRPLNFWVPLIRVPADPSRLGESQWKPRYRLIPDGASQAVETLPGHLVMVDPEVFRLPIVYRILQLSYKTRNRSVAYRRAVIARRVLGSLLAEDLRRLCRFQAPTLTWDVVRNGLAIARGLRSGQMSADDLAKRTERMFVLRSVRQQFPQRQGRMPVLEGLSMAKDIDTLEEAKEAEYHLLRESTSP
jgi:hypothetical protein